ncbi:hypothetical protein M011DRAFT_458531 [Sporormia fimetaria CBS 119925]|uniref:Uncharacterized protein n=1 Tax=Sporormia fimetaria CBS 119925 TaxID=1340428 RepID=A0A6A6V9E0_9PLEO|nr:hypothetical protein M011DRAFT_458531 [Sporormia fimetaria CBS 119925]
MADSASRTTTSSRKSIRHKLHNLLTSVRRVYENLSNRTKALFHRKSKTTNSDTNETNIANPELRDHIHTLREQWNNLAPSMQIAQDLLTMWDEAKIHANVPNLRWARQTERKLDRYHWLRDQFTGPDVANMTPRKLGYLLERMQELLEQDKSCVDRYMENGEYLKRKENAAGLFKEDWSFENAWREGGEVEEEEEEEVDSLDASKKIVLE